MVNTNQSHEFALYIEKLPTDNAKVILTEPLLVRRIGSILRLKPNEQLLLFDKTAHQQFTLSEVTSKHITGTVGERKTNSVYKPAITLLLPILKRDALESAIYGAVECGVTNIQLITTQKVQRKWGGQKEFDRLQRIIIAAAEQSKCFSFATLLDPVSLETALDTYKNLPLLFADPAGALLQAPKKDCAVLVGPEGDLTVSEKELVKKAGATLFKLTPTILRAEQAVVLSVGSIRMSS